MPGPDIRTLAENVRTFDATLLTGNYQDVGVPTSNPIRIIVLKNITTVTVEISWDGGNTNTFRLSPSSTDTVDLTSNDKGSEKSGGIYLKSRSQFQVRNIDVNPPKTGEIIIQCFY